MKNNNNNNLCNIFSFISIFIIIFITFNFLKCKNEEDENEDKDEFVNSKDNEKESFGATTSQPSSTSVTNVVWTSLPMTGGVNGSTTGTLVITPTNISFSIIANTVYTVQGNFYVNAANGVNISLPSGYTLCDANGTTISPQTKTIANGTPPLTTPSGYNTTFYFKSSSAQTNFTIQINYDLPYGNRDVLPNNSFTLTISNLTISNAASSSSNYLVSGDYGSGTGSSALIVVNPIIGPIINGTLNAYNFNLTITPTAANIVSIANNIQNYIPSAAPTTLAGSYNYINIYTNGKVEFINIPTSTQPQVRLDGTAQGFFIHWLTY